MTGDAAATFISDRSLSDEAVEQALIEEIDLVLDHPQRRVFAPGELIVQADRKLDRDSHPHRRQSALVPD